MWLFKRSYSYMAWLLSVYKKLYLVVPLYSFFSVSALLVGHVTLILTFFLPLKIIILVGSSGMPWYFKTLFSGVSKPVLVEYLVLATVLSYVVHLSSNYIAGTLVTRGGVGILSRSDKIFAFSNYKSVAAGYYRRICSSQASIVFAVVGFVFALSISKEWFAYLSLFVFISYLLVAVMAIHSGIRGWLEKNYTTALSFFSAISFLFLFGCIIYSFLNQGEKVSIIIAIVSMLLGRHILQRLAGFVMDAIMLYANKERIEQVVFFRTDNTKEAATKNDVWSFVGGGIPRLQPYLRSAFGEDLIIRETKFFQLGKRNIVGLEVVCDCATTLSGQSCFFIKIYAPNADHLARHEVVLYSYKNSIKLPVPRFIKAIDADGFTLLVCESFSGQWLPHKVARARSVDQLVASWQVKPGNKFVDRYQRSHKMLGARLSLQKIVCLRLACVSVEDQNIVDKFSKQLDSLKLLLNSLPMFIYNPDLNNRTLLQLGNHEYLVSEWSRWAIEPIGAGWDIQRLGLDRLSTVLISLSSKSDVFENLDDKHVIVAAIAFELDKLCRRYQYQDAISLLKESFHYIESV